MPAVIFDFSRTLPQLGSWLLNPAIYFRNSAKTWTEKWSWWLLGGFPEPFLSGSEVEARRWSREYRNRLVREEVVGLERVQDLGNLELLALRLPELVGAPLSVNALREDLQLSHKTGELAPHARASLRDIPLITFWSTAHPSSEKSAKALSIRLVAGAFSTSSF